MSVMSDMEKVGYESAVSDLNGMIDNLLQNENLDLVPTALTLRVLKASMVRHMDDLGLTDYESTASM